MLYCPSCGARVGKTAKFCKECGFHLQAEETKDIKKEVPNGTVINIYPLGIERSHLQQAIRNLKLPAQVSMNVKEANLIVTSHSQYLSKPHQIRYAESAGIRLYIVEDDCINDESIGDYYGTRLLEGVISGILDPEARKNGKMTTDIYEIAGTYAKIAEYLFTNISMGEWQPPRLNQPISWDDIKRLHKLRSDIEKRGSKLRKQGVANTYPELHGLYEQFEAEFGGYVIYGLSRTREKALKEDDALEDQNERVYQRVCYKSRQILMASTCPKVLTGRIPLEVRLHDWFHSFFSSHHVYRLYTTLWYEAVMWGYEEWQQFNNNYRYYMKSEVGWSDYITDWGKQMFVFQIWLTRYGYTWKDAWTIRKKTFGYPEDNDNPLLSYT